MHKLVVLFAMWIAIGMVHAEDANESIIVRVYPVADLVAQPFGGSAEEIGAAFQQLQITGTSLNALAGAESREETRIAENLDELAELLQIIAVPDHWSTTGGNGRIASHRKTLCLVVRQTKAGHEEVEEVLQQLRRQNDVKVEVTLEFLTEKSQPKCNVTCPPPIISSVHPYQAVPQASAVTPAALPTDPRPAPSPEAPIGPLIAPVVEPIRPVSNAIAVQPLPPTMPPQPSKVQPPTPVKAVRPLQDIVKSLCAKHGASMNADELKEFRSAVANSSKTAQVHSATLANGRSRFLLVANTTPIISADRRFVDVHISSPLSPALSSSVTVPDGETAVINFLDLGGDGSTVLVTAKVLVAEEEEELILNPAQKTR